MTIRSLALILAMMLAAFAVSANIAYAQEQSADRDRGRSLYASIGCYQCHGYAGQGGMAGPQLSGKEFGLEGITQQLRHPYGEMPPYTARVLTGADIAALWTYIKTFK